MPRVRRTATEGFTRLQHTLRREHARSIPLGVAAYRWFLDRYQPAIERLAPLLHETKDGVELYCQVLEHKWFLSEQAHYDVGMDKAIGDFLSRRLPPKS